MNQTFDVIIIGGGHAGIEAALAAHRLNCRTLLCTLSENTIGLMPCNPSIGGPAKGQIVGEIDALGGEMGKTADETHIQMKILNRSRGPAVHCLRSQNDKFDYQKTMQQKIQAAKNITLCLEEVLELIIENHHIKGIKTVSKTFSSPTVIITTGTFLKANMHTGLTQKKGGRINEQSADSLSDSLRKHFKLGRLKTGTPPRLDSHSINYDELTIEPGDNEFLHFSFRTPYSTKYKNQIPCHLSYTNPDTHKIILNNLDRSPMYTDVIKGIGPRYCPSIEDKVVRFKDKENHHIFIEPEGHSTNSIYPQGLNTSLPEDVQDALLRSMPGLRDVKILKFGYAVEYDFVYPSQLKPTLETKAISGLFLAGQINGTSGYEEAAGQGIIAGINAGLKSQNQSPFILTREDSFIGTMIDDLITKDIYEPYRMLTSRSEYRLLLRQDNAIFRLSEKAYSIGLLSEENITQIREEKDRVTHYRNNWNKTSTPESIVKQYQLRHKIPLAQFIKRPDVSRETLIDHQIVTTEEKEAIERALVEIKYDGYIKKQEDSIQKVQEIENVTLPENLDYTKIKGLKKESQEKLIQYQPKTIFEAKKIAGINPADISILLVYLKRCFT